MKRMHVYLLVISAGLLITGCKSEPKEPQEPEDRKGYFKSMSRAVNKTKAIQQEMAQRMVDATGSISRTSNTEGK
jgi:PBP1b-binding outer membrane lipoprotein LpoB